MGETMKVKIDEILFEKLVNLKALVENLSKEPDIALRGGVYKEMAKVDIMTVTHDNWTIGYKVIPGLISNLNRIFVKVEGYKLEEIPSIQSNPVMVTIFDVFLDRHQEAPSIQMIAPDALRIEQVSTPLASRLPVIGRRIIQ